MEMEKNRQGGMTLVEILAVMVILVLVMSGVFLFFDQLFRNWYRVAEQQRLQAEANNVIERISRDLAAPEGGGTVLDVVVTADQLEITIAQPGGGNLKIKYQFQQDSTNVRTQLRRGVGNQSPIPIGLGDVDYTGSRFDPSYVSQGWVGIRLHLTGPRGMTYELESSLPFRFAQ